MNQKLFEENVAKRKIKFGAGRLGNFYK